MLEATRERTRRLWPLVERQRLLQYTVCIYCGWKSKVFFFNGGAHSRHCKFPNPAWSSRHWGSLITQSEFPHTDLPSEMTWEVAHQWWHFTQEQWIQRKTAKSRGSPFLCCLEFPSCLWKWIKFMSSMKQSKSSSSSLAKETLILFFLQLSSARTAFIRCIHHMHFLSRTRKSGQHFFSITIAIYPKYCGESLFFLACRLFPGVHGTYQHVHQQLKPCYS